VSTKRAKYAKSAETIGVAIEQVLAELPNGVQFEIARWETWATLQGRLDRIANAAAELLSNR